MELPTEFLCCGEQALTLQEYHSNRNAYSNLTVHSNLSNRLNFSINIFCNPIQQAYVCQNRYLHIILKIYLLLPQNLTKTNFSISPQGLNFSVFFKIIFLDANCGNFVKMSARVKGKMCRKKGRPFLLTPSLQSISVRSICYHRALSRETPPEEVDFCGFRKTEGKINSVVTYTAMQM